MKHLEVAEAQSAPDAAKTSEVFSGSLLGKL